MTSALRAGLALAVAVLSPVPISSQESKSEPLAKQLVTALGAAKLESVAALDAANPEFYVGVLHIPGVMLLAVTAKFPVPAALDAKISTAAYRDVYLDLSAGAAIAKIFVEDMGADGLSAKRRADEAFDSVDLEGKKVSFDGQARRQKLSDDEYQQAFTQADARYAQMLTALLAQLKKGS
jgi:hypothetical protein